MTSQFAEKNFTVGMLIAVRVPRLVED